MAEAKPLVLLSTYNHQGLSHEAEFQRRRFQSFERSHRAAGEALQALLRERQNLGAKDADKADEQS
jgi:hypothetical protein